MCKKNRNFDFDREGRIAGWKRTDDEGLLCEACAEEWNSSDPVTMQEVGENVTCAKCGRRIS